MRDASFLSTPLTIATPPGKPPNTFPNDNKNQKPPPKHITNKSTNMTSEAKNQEVDYTLTNPDTLTKYKAAAEVSAKVLDHVTKQCVAGAKIVEICAAGDKFLEEEIAKVCAYIPRGLHDSDLSGLSGTSG